MLTRFVRAQLVIFAIASLVGISVMLLSYMQIPTMLGWGRITVTMELPATGGLYSFANVTLRGMQLGKVTAVTITDTGAAATLSLASSPRVPTDLQAQVRSVSAVGEQYVDLVPRTDSGPFLEDGSVIPVEDTTIPQQVGPMLDQVSELLQSIPKDRLSDLLDESFTAFNGAGYDLGSLLDSSSTISHETSSVAGQTQTLITDSGPLLDSAAETADATRIWAASLAGITEQIASNDPEIRTLLSTGPGFADEVTGLLNQVQPTLPILLANLTSVGQVGLTYHPSIEQLLVLLPAYVAGNQSFAVANKNATGLARGDFALTIGDPSVCTVGFLPPSSWRSPEDTTTIDTPDGLYCKLPQDSPIAVRGARNYPCIGQPGKRAPTVQLCNDPNGFQPLAERQHAIGPSPLDPNLVSQGVPPDTRYAPDSNIYGPTGGTPMPMLPPPVVPSTIEPAPEQAAPQENAPASFDTDESGPSVAFATYDPQTGLYMTPGGETFNQADLAASTGQQSWQDMLLG